MVVLSIVLDDTLTQILLILVLLSALTVNYLELNEHADFIVKENGCVGYSAFWI